MAVWWEKYDSLVKFDKVMREPSVKVFLDAVYIIFLLSVIIHLTDNTVWIWIAAISIITCVIDIVDSVKTFLKGAPENIEARAYDEGFQAGKSRAMRHMSDEPGLSLEMDTNPYEKS